MPVNFSSEKSVKWKKELPGASAGTPIIYGEYVFISSVEIEDESNGKGKLLALCFNKKTGSLLWSKNAGSGYRPGDGDGFDYQLDSRSNYASPSPVTDGQRAIFFFGNGDLVSFLMDGSEEWRKKYSKRLWRFLFSMDFFIFSNFT